MELKEAIGKRHSTRNFKKHLGAVRLKDVFEVLESALHAPMAGNVCTLRVVLVEDKMTKERIAKNSPGNEFLGEADKILAVFSDPKQAKNMYGEKGEIYAHQQAGAAIQNMLLTATSLNIGSCWVGSFDEGAVKRLLKIPGEFKMEALIPLGKEFKKAERRRKPSFKEVVFYNKFGKKIQ